MALLSWERLRILFCQQEYQLSFFSQLIETCEKISKLSTLKSFRQNGVTFPGFSVSCQDFVRPNRPRSRVIEAAPYAVCLALFGVSPLSKSSWGLLLTADRRRTLRTVGENIWKRTNRFKAMSQHSQDLYGTDTTFKQKTLNLKVCNLVLILKNCNLRFTHCFKCVLTLWHICLKFDLSSVCSVFKLQF